MSDLVTRREAIARAAYILGGVISAPTLAGVLAGCERRAPEAASAAKALSSDQKEMIAKLADHVIPPTDTPGASAAGVQDFMDVMMAEYYPPAKWDQVTADPNHLAGLNTPYVDEDEEDEDFDDEYEDEDYEDDDYETDEADETNEN